MKKGFTLIEMIITIVVIIVLSSISVPIYNSYQHDAMMAEGYVLLSSLREAQKNYYSQYGNFLYYGDSSAKSNIYTHNDTVLGIDARGNKYFDYFCVGCLVTGGTRTCLDYYIQPAVFIPTELRGGDDNKRYLVLQYNITLGQRIIYSKDNAGSGWS